MLAMHQGVTLHGLEQLHHAPCRRPPTGTPLGVHGQCLDLVPLHRSTQLTLQKGLHQQREEVDAQQGLDAVHRLEVYGATSKSVLSCENRFSIAGCRL